MATYPLQCTVRRTESTLDLLNTLDALNDDPDFEPGLFATWSPGPPDQEFYDLRDLAALLDEPRALRKPRTGHTPSPRLTWHCSIRNTTQSGLSDDHWWHLLQQVLNATGIQPQNDPNSCRWLAVRSTADRLDIVATVIRQDGSWARLHNDHQFAQYACERFAADHELNSPKRLR
ncbi:hypothetical protein [Kitasatospora sp. NPDC097643]|uniref:hypothetical protein n=1 Tax=Kitasatospora sp. NPDC097643 TaxID=3157230 RepID=UPI00332E61FE